MPQFRSWVEIDTSALGENLRQFRMRVSKKVRIMAVVKSNAYGHGTIECAHVFQQSADWFGVDDIDEATRLRKSGIKKPILVLGYTLPARYKEASSMKISFLQRGLQKKLEQLTTKL